MKLLGSSCGTFFEILTSPKCASCCWGLEAICQGGDCFCCCFFLVVGHVLKVCRLHSVTSLNVVSSTERITLSAVSGEVEGILGCGVGQPDQMHLLS